MSRPVATCARISLILAAVACVAGVPALAQAQSLAGGWTAQDIGSVGASGYSSGSGGSLTLRGAGSDIWGGADGFHFAYRTLTGDGEIVTKVTGLDYIHAWSKAGVMMRESLSSGSRHAFMLLSAGNGAAFQRRGSTGGSSTHTDAGWYDGYYVKLARSGSRFDAYKSADGSNWTWVGSDSISMSSTIYVGVAVTSHYWGALATATFSSTAVSETAAAAPTGSLPSGWASRDIGGVGAGGWADSSGGSFTVGGSGSDVWGSADEFHFAYRTLTGDGTIVARVGHVDYLDSWSKAGVMMRESLNAGAAHAYMLVSAGKGLAFQRRGWSGGQSSNTGAGGGAPAYVKLQRSGSTFSAYMSWDGSNWSHVGSESISMGGTIYVGLAVTSHADGSVASASFSGVDVSNYVEPAPVAAPVANETVSGSSLRVLHWNVHHLIGTDGVFDPWRIANWIAHMNPHIVSLNEVDDAWHADQVTHALNSITGMNWNTKFSGWGNLILSRMPINNSSVCTFNPGAGRKAAHVSTTFNGRAINLWSAHLATEGSGTRLYEVYNLQNCASAWGSGQIIAGDFNMQASSTEYYAAITGYTDAWAAARSMGTTTNYSGNCDGCTRNSRIDYVFSAGSAWYLSVQSSRIYDTRDGYGYMPSDHKPMVVTYTVR